MSTETIQCLEPSKSEVRKGDLRDSLAFSVCGWHYVLAHIMGVYSLGLFSTELSPERYWWQSSSQKTGEEEFCLMLHCHYDHLEERGMERSSLKGQGRAIVNQPNIGTVSKVTLGKLLSDWVERIWAFLSTQMPPWTELSLPEWLCIMMGNNENHFNVSLILRARVTRQHS